MTDLVARINAVRLGADARAADLKDGDALKSGLTALSGRADTLRKEIVATKEGGAITGEERLREFTDQLYGAINGYEGAPAAYQLTRIDVLNGQLIDISGRFDALASGDLAARNADLAARKLSPITLPPAGADGEGGAGGGKPSGSLMGYAFSLHPTATAAVQTGERD